MQSKPITTKVVSSNFTHGEVYSIQYYVIKFSMTYDRSVFFSGTPVSSTNKTNHHNITETLLKVAMTAPEVLGNISHSNELFSQQLSILHSL